MRDFLTAVIAGVLVGATIAAIFKGCFEAATYYSRF